MGTKRAELHCHTGMTVEGGVQSAYNLVKLAYESGLSAIAITDHDSVQAYYDAYRATEELLKAGRKLKLIHGLETRISDNNSKSFPAVILVRDNVGLKNLYKLMSKLLTGEYDQSSGIPKDEIRKFRDGLLIGSCGRGEIEEAMLMGDVPEKELPKIASFYDYIEIQPVMNSDYLGIGSKCEIYMEKLPEINTRVVSLGKETGIPVIASSNVYYARVEDELSHRILRNLHDPEKKNNSLSNYLMTTDEMLREYDYLGSEAAKEVVIDNPDRIAGMIGDVELVHYFFNLPRIPDIGIEIKDLCYKRAHELYGDNLPETVSHRLEWEMTATIRMEYQSIYAIIAQHVKMSKDKGFDASFRANGSSSLMGYLLGISDINPLPPHYLCSGCHHSDFEIEYGDDFHLCDVAADLPDRVCPVCGEKMKKEGFDLPAESFLGIDGEREPYFSLIYAGEYAESARKLAGRLRGVSTALYKGSIESLGPENAEEMIRDYFKEENTEISDPEIEMIANSIESVKAGSDLMQIIMSVIPEGTEIEKYSPVQRVRDKLVMHISDYQLSHNLMTIEIFGHFDLSMIKMLKDETGVDPESIPFDDERVMSLLTSVEELGIRPDQIGDISVGTLGVSWLGSHYYTTEVLPKVRITRISDLIRLYAFFHDTGAWIGNAETFISEGEAKYYECVANREDIMYYLLSRGADRVTAFTVMESVRKGRLARDKYDKKTEDLLRKYDVPDWYIESCHKIQYAMPKSQSVNYMLMIWRILYYKLYYPREFYRSWFRYMAKTVDREFIDLGYENACREYAYALRVVNGSKCHGDFDRRVNEIPVVMEMIARGIEL